MTLRCVPVEQDENMDNAFDVALTGWDGCNNQSMWDAMLTSAPPPPADIAEALELAKRVKSCGSWNEEKMQLSCALLKSWGRAD